MPLGLSQLPSSSRRDVVEEADQAKIALANHSLLLDPSNASAALELRTALNRRAERRGAEMRNRHEFYAADRIYR